MEITAYRAYFEDIATRLKEIQHTPEKKRFARINIEEVFTSLRSKLDLANFSLVLESPEGNLGATNNDSIFDNQLGAFMILKRCKEEDFAAEELILDQAKVIALKVVAKMRYDAENRQGIKNFDISSVTYEKVGPIFENSFGLRVQFSVYESVRLVHNEDDFLPV